MLKHKPVVRAVLAALGGVAGAVSVHTGAQAQTSDAQSRPPQQLERVEVTGSNIKRSETETVSPVQIIARQEIERSGKSTAAEYLRGLTVNTGNSYNENFSIGTSPGGASMALRGLSPKNTLVLLNSRRLANYGLALNLQDTYVDLNNIPINAIERIEILKDGASAVYGSDAIAGVVNIILRQNFSGASVGASYGLTGKHKGDDMTVNATFGAGNLQTEGYNLMLSGSFYRREGVLMSDRPYTSSQIFRDADSQAVFGPGGYAFAGSSGSAGFWRPPAPNPNRVAFANCGADGTSQIIPASQFTPVGAPTLSGTGCWYNLAEYVSLMPEVYRAQLAANGSLRIGANTTLFADAIYSNSTTKQKFSPSFISNTSTAFDPTTGGVRPVSNTVINNPFGIGTGVGVTYSFRGVGGRNAETNTELYRVLAGLKGSIGDWDWQSAVGRSESRTDQMNFNGIRVSEWNRLRQDPSFDITTLTTNAAANDALRVNFKRTSNTVLNTADARVTGDLAALPGGALALATGVEYRHESMDDTPDDALAQGEVLGRAATRTVGDRDVVAAFAELSIPMWKQIELSLAGRADRYSDFGSAFSPRAGLRIQPVRELLFRSTWSRGFRAPTLPESGSGSQVALTRLSDPNVGGAAQSAAVVYQANPDLKPECSTNLNFGAVFAPSAAFSASADWYYIKQTNVVGVNDFQFILNNPALFPGQVVRSGAGTLLAITERWRNLGELRTAGVDFDVRGMLRTPVGRVRADLLATYLAKYEQQIVAGQPAVNLAGNNQYSTAFPRWKATSGLGLESGDWATRFAVNFINSYNQQRRAHAQSGPGYQTRVASSTTYDFFLGYQGTKNLKLTASVVNIFDREPPFDAFQLVGVFASKPYDTALYDARGRVFRVGFEYKFL